MKTSRAAESFFPPQTPRLVKRETTSNRKSSSHFPTARDDETTSVLSEPPSKTEVVSLKVMWNREKAAKLHAREAPTSWNICLHLIGGEIRDRPAVLDAAD